MKISHITTLLLLLLFFGACQQGGNNTTYHVFPDTLTVHHQYYRYGETTPFMDEYGRVIRNHQGDSLKLYYCKDSSVTFHTIAQKYIRNTKTTCFPQSNTFLNSKLIANAPLKLSNGGRIENKIVASPLSKNKFHIHRKIAQQIFIDTLIIHSNEYWSDSLGLILKVDQNKAINRKRIIQLKSAILPNGDSVQFQNMLPQLYADSTTWLLKD